MESRYKYFIQRDNLKRTVLFVLTFLFVYSILMSSLVMKKYNLKEGEIAKVNIKSTREVKDEITTQARIQQAVEAVPPQYSKKIEVKTEVLSNINALFSLLYQLREGNLAEKEKLSKLQKDSPIQLAEENFTLLLKLTNEDAKDLQNFLTNTMSEIYEGNIMENKQDDIKKTQETILLKFNSSKLSKSIRDLGLSIGYSQVKPNLFYDEKKTNDMKTEASKKVPPVMIKKDQIIVKESEPVTIHQIEILKELGLLNNTSKFEWAVYISLAVLVLLILTLKWYYIKKHYNDSIYRNFNLFTLVNFLIILSLVLARSVGIISPFLIPLACAPMLLTILVDYKISLALSTVNCIFVGAVVGFNTEIILISLSSAVLGAIVLKKMQQRNDIFYSALYIAVINGLLTLSVGMVLSTDLFEVLKKAGCTIIGGLLSAVLTIGLLPVLESIFDIVTTIKLLELSNTNHPLLKKLLIEAPGTYHHSILVANLAEVAVEEVGGNSVFARVAAYYHDIGKIKRPYFFKENQLGIENPHDKISTHLSALIITSHVKDGIELARDFKIPKVIQDVIEQHHGNSLVKYFYITAKNTAENPDEIKEEDFRYAGPLPVSKEVGIIMLADAVEAAVRSINIPTKEKIEEMVDRIIKGKLNEGQLDMCDLTLKDLDKIKQCFIKALLGIYHQRIEYPIENETQRKKGIENDINR